MSFKRKISALLMSAGLVTGVAIVGADSASAAGGVNPVCYYKKVVTQQTFGQTVTVYNLVDREVNLQYPARTKECYITQTQHINRRGLPDTRKIIWTGKITVRY